MTPFIRRQITQIRKGGCVVLFSKTKLGIRLLLKWLVLFGIYSPPAFILRLLNFRFGNFFVNRIGHLLSEPDCYLKEERLGLIPKRRIIMLAPKNQVANQAVLRYWRQYFFVLTNSMIERLLRPFSRHPLTALDVSKYCVAINGTAESYKVQALWSDSPPLLKINPEDICRGEKALAEIGLPRGTWFVCVHSRDGGYSPKDEPFHSYRNSNFEDYRMAIEFISSQGGVCIAMGDSSMQPIPKMTNLIDYAHDPIRNDWLDLYIAANCRFFLGNTSGAFIMSSVFGVSVACANMAPFSAQFPFGNKDIGIPKLYKKTSSGRLLPFKEILDSPMGNFRYSSDFNSAGIELIDNSPEDILDLAIEQFERTTDPDFVYNKKDDVLQRRFRDLYKPGHYSYGSASRIGRAFLNNYQYLLP
jgi:putative glycosyltransferase (TIGR04372 family)